MKRPLDTAQVLARIESLNTSIRKANEYLESGEHANWAGFRPLFDCKLKDGKEMPPHKDWVRNVFLRRMERSLQKAEKTLWRLERESGSLQKIRDSGIQTY